jgi:tetratricopeptide (TPR) repeat protein
MGLLEQPWTLLGLTALLLLIPRILLPVANGPRSWETVWTICSRIGYDAINFPAFRFLPIYSRWIGQQPIFAAELGVVLAFALTPLGADYGIPQLFWHDDAFTLFMNGYAIAGLAIILWSLSCLVETAEWHSIAVATFDLSRPIPWRWTRLEPVHGTPTCTTLVLANWALFAPLLTVLVIVSVFTQIAQPTGNWLLLPCGAFAAWLSFVGAVRIWSRIGLRNRTALPAWVRLTKNWQKRFFLSSVVAIAVIIAVLASNRDPLGVWFSAVMALCTLLAGIAVISHATQDLPLLRVLIVLVAIPWIAYSNSDKFKLKFPGFDAYYPAAQSDGRNPVTHFATKAGFRDTGARLSLNRLYDYNLLVTSRVLAELDQASARVKADPKNQQATAELAYWKARAKLCDGDIDGVISEIGKAWRLFPANVVYRDCLAVSYCMRAAEYVCSGRPQRAMSDLSSALKLKPNDNSVRTDRALLAFLIADTAAARSDLERLTSEDTNMLVDNSINRPDPKLIPPVFPPRSPPPASDLAPTDAKAYAFEIPTVGAPRDDQQSVADLRSELTKAAPPSNAPFFSMEPKIMEQMRMMMELRDPLAVPEVDLLSALKRIPNRSQQSGYDDTSLSRPQMALNFGRVNFRIGNYPQARSFMKLALDWSSIGDDLPMLWSPGLPPNIKEATTTRLRMQAADGYALADLLLKHPPKLIDKLISLQRADPWESGTLTREGKNDPLLWYALANEHAQADLTKAKEEFTKASNLDPDDDIALDRRAICSSQLGDEASAAADRKSAAHRRARSVARAQAEAIKLFATSPRGDDKRSNVSEPMDDLSVLNRWLAARLKENPQRPILFVVATSGGGICAAVWTVACLSELDSTFPVLGFPRRIRVIFGASGGMVGAGAYIASLEAPGVDPDRRKTLAKLKSAVSADSLTPTMIRMLLYDLPACLIPNPRGDRGQALESAWNTFTKLTDVKMARLAMGEWDGWRPSLVVSPMIVEGAKRLLISNLRLGGLSQSEELFEIYPKSWRDFRLGTALRMNASFPLVSPGVYLPDGPARPNQNSPVARRVVDAGYLDNYGVFLACAWIEKHKGWLLANTSGVRLVRLVAYPGKDPKETDSLGVRVRRGFESVHTPLEGFDSARQRTMTDQANNAVDELKDWFNDGAPAGTRFFDDEVLECGYPAPLSWRLSKADGKLIERSIKSPEVKTKIKRILDWIPPAESEHGDDSSSELSERLRKLSNDELR